MTALREAVERAARALGVAGRHTLTLYEVPRDGWQVFDGRTPLMPAIGHGSVTTTTEAVAGAARFMDASARAEVTVDGVLLFNALRPHVDAPTGAVVLTCVKPPVLALPKDDLTAALVLLCHALPETRERCPGCKSKGIEHVARETPPPGYRCPNGWARNVVQGRWERPCARCSATGWVPRSWGAVLLGAMPRDARYKELLAASAEPADTFGWRDMGNGYAHPTVPGNTDDREQASVLADDRMRHGDTLGEWLALWLDAVPCRACDGVGWTWGDDVDDHVTDNRYSCEDCRGSGLELGAHEQVIVSALNNLCANLQKATT